MKLRALFLSFIVPLAVQAQQVGISVGDQWHELKAQQTQSELRPGWKIVDVQTKSKLTHYLWGSRASQLSDGRQPVFRIVPGRDETLVDYVVMPLKRCREYRKLRKPALRDNIYQRIEPPAFSIKVDEGDAFVCQPAEALAPGEYILVNIAQKPVGELGDLMVYPFSVE